jgi:hypothetical protein
MAMFPRPCWTCLAVSVLLLGTAHAQTVYSWKDAKGVTHYSDAPPPKQAGKAAVRTISVPAAPAAAPTVAASAPAAASTAAAAARNANEAAGQARCAQARANLTALQGTAPVGPDTDGDGKPDSTLSADDRAKQVASMQAAIQRDCSGA